MSDLLDRTSLPQIPKDQIENFILFLKDKNIRSKFMYLDPQTIHPIQKAVNKDKVKTMMKDKNIASIPIIVDEDGNILDGHHRFIALVVLKDKRISVLKCFAPIDVLIELGHQFDGSYVGKSTHIEK